MPDNFIDKVASLITDDPDVFCENDNKFHDLKKVGNELGSGPLERGAAVPVGTNELDDIEVQHGGSNKVNVKYEVPQDNEQESPGNIIYHNHPLESGEEPSFIRAMPSKADLQAMAQDGVAGIGVYHGDKVVLVAPESRKPSKFGFNEYENALKEGDIASAVKHLTDKGYSIKFMDSNTGKEATNIEEINN